MNEDQHGIEGYIGTSAIAELTYVVMGNLNRGRKVDIQILKMPSKEQNCYNEVKFWLDQEIIEIFHRPTGKKATIPVADNQLVKSVESGVSQPATEPTPSRRSSCHRYRRRSGRVCSAQSWAFRAW